MRLAAALFTPSWVACGSTVDVAFESGSVVPVFDAGASSDAGQPPSRRECGTKQATAPCGAVEVVDCNDAGQQLVTRVEPLDCDITRGFTGAATELAFACQDAFDGQSGNSCSGERTCVRRTLVGCCLEFAACHGEEPVLLRSRACAQNCPAFSPTVERGQLFQGCASLLDALARLADPYRLLGAPCSGDFICSEGLGEIDGRELPFMPELQAYFCVGTQIQILNALTWPSVSLPALDAGMAEQDAGYADAAAADAGLTDASLGDAAAQDAGDSAEAQAGLVDAANADGAGP